MKTIARVLLIIGGLNWGLWGLFEYDLVASIFGSSTAAASKVVYTLVGLSAIYELFTTRWRERKALRSRDQIDKAA